MKRRFEANERSSGGALVMALLAVIAVSVMAAGFLQLACSTMRRSTHSIDSKQAMYVAEAGLAEAYIGLGMAKTGNVGTQAAPAVYGNGLFWVEANDIGNDQVQLESTAMWGVGRVTLGLVVERVEESVGTLGMFSSNDIRVEPGTLIDSYDSQSGMTYDAQVDAGLNNHSATFGSNGAITINGGAQGSEVRGDVAYGPTDDLTQNGSVTISGTTGARPMPVALPDPVVPTVPMAGPLNVGDDALPQILASGEHGFESIRVGPDSQLIVIGPSTLVVGSAELDSGANIQFDVSGGPVEVFVTQELRLNAGSTVTNTLQDPTLVTVQVSPPERRANNVSLSSNTEFHGTIYAPGSEVFLASGFEVFGAAIADQLVLSQGAQLHVDLAYGSFENSLPRLVNWRVIDIPDAIATKGQGPFQVLGVDESTLLKPSLAHEDQWLTLEYIDKTGLRLNYDGWESQFDWSTVAEIVGGTRDGVSLKSVQPPPPPPGPSTPPPGTPSDWIADTSINSSELRDFLLDASPLTNGEINDAITREPPMNASHLMDVLDANQPLAHGTLNLMLDAPSPLSPAQIRDEMLRNSPLVNGDLNGTIDSLRLTDPEIRDVLIANSKLSNPVITHLDEKIPPMNQADYDLVMAAQ